MKKKKKQFDVIKDYEVMDCDPPTDYKPSKDVIIIDANDLRGKKR